MSCKDDVQIEAGMVVQVVKDGMTCLFMSSYGVLKPVNINPEGGNLLVLSASACDGTFDQDVILQDLASWDIIYAHEEQLGNVKKICPKCRAILSFCPECGELEDHPCRDDD
jgi:hypothetical protein